jgi:phytanoyl-CoA hydroxylase
MLKPESFVEQPVFHSKYGGLWIDRSDWQQHLAAHRLDDEQIKLVEHFVEDGYVILEQAVPMEKVDAFQRKIEKSFRDGNSSVLYQRPGESESRPLTEPIDRLGTRIVDSFVAIPEALDIFTSPRLVRFLSTIFDDTPHLFQSLSFDQGSQQGLHQDTAYVVVNRPLELAACWIALEDVQQGSGELMYAPGSHRNPEFDFGGNRKYWDPTADGMEAHDRWAKHLRDEAAKNPKGMKTFLAKKGDILVWHADLAHGGSPVTRPELTRQSLVGHFCPLSASPHHFSIAEKRDRVERHGPIAYSSWHYDLRKIHQPKAVGA